MSTSSIDSRLITLKLWSDHEGLNRIVLPAGEHLALFDADGLRVEPLASAARRGGSTKGVRLVVAANGDAWIYAPSECEVRLSHRSADPLRAFQVAPCDAAPQTFYMDGVGCVVERSEAERSAASKPTSQPLYLSQSDIPTEDEVEEDEREDAQSNASEELLQPAPTVIRPIAPCGASDAKPAPAPTSSESPGHPESKVAELEDDLASTQSTIPYQAEELLHTQLHQPRRALVAPSRSDPATPSGKVSPRVSPGAEDANLKPKMADNSSASSAMNVTPEKQEKRASLAASTVKAEKRGAEKSAGTPTSFSAASPISGTQEAGPAIPVSFTANESASKALTSRTSITPPPRSHLAAEAPEEKPSARPSRGKSQAKDEPVMESTTTTSSAKRARSEMSSSSTSTTASAAALRDEELGLSKRAKRTRGSEESISVEKNPVRVLFTGIAPSNQDKAAVKALHGVLDEDPSTASHMIIPRSGELKRTLKALRVLVRLGPSSPRVVTEDWLKDGETSKHRPKTLAKMLDARDKATKGVFHGWTLACEDGQVPPELIDVVREGEGAFELSSATAAKLKKLKNIEAGRGVLVIKDESAASKAVVKAAKEIGLAVVKLGWIGQSIVQGEARLEGEHLL